MRKVLSLSMSILQSSQRRHAQRMKEHKRVINGYLCWRKAARSTSSARSDGHQNDPADNAEPSPMACYRPQQDVLSLALHTRERAHTR